MRSLILVPIVCLLITSCVPARLLDENKSKLNACETDLAGLKKTSQENESVLAQLKEQTAKDQKSLDALKRDTTQMGSNLRTMTSKYERLNALNDQLMNRLDRLVAGQEKDNAKLSGSLQLTQEQLLRKQDTLRALEVKLMRQKSSLDSMNTELKKREARVNELEAIIKQKEEASENLRKKLSEALVGFEGKGLTINHKNGKVYVSMDESLLFASGKTNVEPKGVEALKKVAKVLEQNTDISVMVEGHTDDVPMNGTGDIKDNWDLSVMRATSVTKIMLSSAKIDGQRITSAGRGEYFPLDKSKTPEARKKNRRTEIILSPKLDEILKVLDLK